MMKIPRQSYTEEFKREALKLVEGGQKPAEVARLLGINENALNNWRKAVVAGKLKGSGKQVTTEQMELSRRRAENLRLKMALEIVKKRRLLSRRGRE